MSRLVRLHTRLQRSLFSATKSVPYDTNKFISGLAANGFTEPQALQISTIFSEILAQQLQVLEEGCVARDDFEQALHRRSLEFLNTKADVETHSRNNVVERNAFIEQVARELAAISQSSSDQVAALKAESSLEVSLEKSKLKTALMRAALDMQDLRDTIDIGSSNALADLANLRNDIFYSALGFFCTSVAAFLGYLRYCS